MFYCKEVAYIFKKAKICFENLIKGCCLIIKYSRPFTFFFFFQEQTSQSSFFLGCLLSDISTDLTRVQPVQALVDPLLHVQSLLQLLPVVLDGNPGMSLRYRTPQIWWMNFVIFLQRRPGPVGSHFWSGVAWLVSPLFQAQEERAAVGGDGGGDCWAEVCSPLGMFI